MESPEAANFPSNIWSTFSDGWQRGHKHLASEHWFSLSPLPRLHSSNLQTLYWKCIITPLVFFVFWLVSPYSQCTVSYKSMAEWSTACPNASYRCCWNGYPYLSVLFLFLTCQGKVRIYLRETPTFLKRLACSFPGWRTTERQIAHASIHHPPLCAHTLVQGQPGVPSALLWCRPKVSRN